MTSLGTVLIANPKARNLAALYASLVVNAAVNLLMMAWLARTLGPDNWGLVLLAQGVGFVLAALPEFGFSMSATRELAQLPAQDRGRFAAATMGGKAILSLAIVPLAVVAFMAIPAFRANPMLLAGAACFAFAQGFDPDWIFGGAESQFIYAVIATASRLLLLLATYLLIDGPGDTAMVMFLYAAMAAVVAISGLLFCLARMQPFSFTWRAARQSLRIGRDIFYFRLALSLLNRGSIIVLGIVAPAAVASFGSAERIVRNALGLLGPISAFALPRVSVLITRDRNSARRVARTTFGITLAYTLAIAALIVLFAPQLVRLLLGPEYGSAVPALLILALLVPVSGLNMMIATHWLMPNRLDKVLRHAAGAAGVANAIGCALVALHFGAAGAAVTLVVSESLMLAALMMIASSKRHSMWASR